MRFAPGQTIGPAGLPTFPPPCLAPPIRVTAPEPARFVVGTAPPGHHRRDPFTAAIDFDGVLCRSRWPGIGPEMPGGLDFLRWLVGLGCKRVLWTCRDREALDAALAWLAARGFGRDWWAAVNANTPESIAYFGRDSRKSGAHVFVDDRAVGFPFDPVDPEVPLWPAIRADIAARLAEWRDDFE